jgi:hypothetical protein
MIEHCYLFVRKGNLGLQKFYLNHNKMNSLQGYRII